MKPAEIILHQPNTGHSPKLTVGLTGGIGSGKTSVAKCFAERGADVIDTDIISHALTATDGAAIEAIRSHFGDDMITPQGAMDRTKMRARIFADANQKHRLESILHPLIHAESLRQANNATGSYILYVIPLLVETGYWKLSRVLVIDCEERLQIQRAMQRDGLPEQSVKAIMAQQATRAQRLAVATDILQNQTTFEALIPEIDRLHQLYKRLSFTN